MKKLKKILHCKSIYYILLIISLVYALFISSRDVKSSYNVDDNTFIGIIDSFTMKNGVVNIRIKGKENLRGTYINNDFNYNIGDIVKIEGNLKLPSKNTVPNLFNYQNYLKSKNEKWVLDIKQIDKVGESKNIIDKIKKIGYQRISSYRSKAYLKLFLFGDKQDIDSTITKSYQTNGISHLFSISGMHLSLLSTIFLIALKKILNFDTIRILLTSILLVIYMLLVGVTASVTRATIFFIIKNIYKKLKIDLPNIYIYYLMIFIILMFKPRFILDIGFEYSVIICFFLLYSSRNANNTNYLLGLLKVSILSFFVSLPISLYNFYEVNILGIIYNLFFVPLVSVIIFPLSLLTIVISFFDPILYYLTLYMEKISLLFSNINCGKLIFIKPSLLWIIIYYLFFILYYRKKYFKYIIPIVLLLITLYIYPSISPNNKITYIDVGQGDSSLLELDKKVILIDTGGKISKYNSNDISENTILPFLKSKGIRKIDYLVLTHGDYDHMGEAINLVNNFKVKKVIFNCGEFNDLEKELIKVLDKKKIKYYSCIKELNIDNNKFYFLQTKEYDNENDNSNVIYTELDSYKFMFMGDAGVEKEKDILNKYNISSIDVLKVGHHGSKTSSSKEFINEINPNYSIISVGKNNRYGHPNKEVLNNLSYSKIYRTDQDGSVMFKIKNNKLRIETYSP